MKKMIRLMFLVFKELTRGLTRDERKEYRAYIAGDLDL